MLIQSSFSTLQNGSLFIPLWNRAPLNLSNNTRVFAGLLASKTRSPTEIVVSPFDPAMWGDLWRIEFDAANKPGLLERTLKLMQKEHVRVVVSESTAIDEGHSHTISLVADCRNYRSDSDRSTADRQSMDRPALHGLYANLAIEFISDLAFTDGARPRLRVRRLRSYHRCYRNLINREMTLPTELKIEAGQLTLSNDLIRDLRETEQADPGELRAMILTDSKDRIMRVLVSKPCSGTIHIRIHFVERMEALTEIARTIRSADLDIVRSQLRQGIFRPPCELVNATPTDFFTLDLLLQTLKDRPPDLKTFIADTLAANPELRTARATVSLAEYYDGGQ